MLLEVWTASLHTCSCEQELLNSYVDVSLPLAKRRAELRDYGFECRCAKCEREAVAEAAAGSSRPPQLPASPAAPPPPQPQVRRPEPLPRSDT